MADQVQAGAFLELGLGAAIGIGAAAGVLLVLPGVWLARRRRLSPAEWERRRRQAVHGKGRICDGNITDCRDGAVYYSYMIAGIKYTASQDVSTLGELLPSDPSTVIGPGSVKYLAGNPANSIVVCEQWSGLRARHRDSRT